MKTLACLCSLLLLPSLLPASEGEPGAGKARPNIILIMADDLGYETIGANGGESYRTPHLDRLAATGARFEHCYAQPLCTPSRVQIMTGKYNVRNYTEFGVLPRTETTFAHLLRDAGYATFIAGKWQLGSEKDSPGHFGFEQSLLWQHTRGGRLEKDGVIFDKRYENPLLERNGTEQAFTDGEFAPDLMVEAICDFIATKRDQPFFVYYPMILTHCPFVPTPDSADWDPRSPGSPSYKGNARYFGDMVAYVDKLVGRIVDELSERGLSDDTVLIFTGDNGTDRPVVSRLKGREVAGAKGSTTDAGTRVPLIVDGPSLTDGAVIRDLVDFSDFLPTICGLAGVEVPAGLDGRSFLPQLRGMEGQPRDHVYCWFSRNGKDEAARVFARTHRYKLYRNGDFFDIPSDPDEEHALDTGALDPSQREVKAMLQGVIDRYQAHRPE